MPDLPLFPLQKIGLDYAHKAPFSVLNSVELPLSPEETWDLLASTAWAEWFVDFVALDWISPEPHGVGSERKATLKTATAIEHFLAWDRGRRLSFRVASVSLPLVKAMMEDMRLQPLPDGGTRLDYYVFYTPNLAMKLLHPIVRAFYARMFRQSLINLRRYVETRRRTEPRVPA